MTPRELGYHMPAEWEPHQATWVSWPHKEASWPGKLAEIQPVFAQFVAVLSRSETVHVNVNDREMERAARRLIERAGETGDVVYHRFPTNDAWCRDHGAIFVRRNRMNCGAGVSPARVLEQDQRSRDGRTTKSRSVTSEIAAVDWQYNAWGEKYPPYDLDNEIPRRMAEELGVPWFDGGMVLEGGSIDVNGAGLLLTTEACLLNPNRNPHLNREQIEARLRDFLGVDGILWLGDGIAGDDTDGHIDDLARFVAEDTIVLAAEDDPADENYEPLRQNRVRIETLIERSNLQLKVVALPMPPPVECEGQRLPASYANFYIGNRVVLLPGYDAQRDRQAADVLRPFFADREIVTIDCTSLVWGLGAFHCLTQQVPG